MVAWKTLYTIIATFNRWNDERHVNVNRNDNGWNDNWWFGGRRNLLHFSPALAGEFCFCSWLFQPPSILPTSLIGNDNEAYFLLSILFVSHRIINKIFKVSNFLIASLIHGCFSSLGKKPAITVPSIISTNNVSIFCPRECRWGLGIIW